MLLMDEDLAELFLVGFGASLLAEEAE